MMEEDLNALPQMQSKIFLKIVKTVAMEVNASDTIEDIKTRVYATEGLEENEQELFSEGKHLKDTSKTLADYDIGTNSTINLFSGGMMHVFVKFPSSEKTIALEVSKEDSIQNVKAKIKDTEEISQNRLGLIYMGKSMEDDHTLVTCGITNGSVLHMVLRPISELHISVCTTNGKLVLLEVRSWYTVRDVKMIFEGMEHVAAATQKLLYNGKVLDDRLTLSECNIADQSVLGLQVEIQIFIKICSGKTITLMVDIYETVASTIKRIEEKMGVVLNNSSQSHPTLSYAGRILERERALADYNIQSGSTIHLEMRPCTCIKFK